MAKKHKFTRNKKDKIITGLLGGLGDYFQVDSTLVRIIFLLVLSFTGFIPGILFYIVGSVVVPIK